MAINLKKGGSTQLDNTMQYGFVGLGWDERRGDQPVDLDLVAFMLGKNGRVIRESDFVFYNNLLSSCGSLTHTGDEKKGVLEGDDEIIAIKFNRIPLDVDRIVFAAEVHDAAVLRTNFGSVRNAFCRFVKMKDNRDFEGEELVYYALSSDYSYDTCMVICELFRSNGEWKFRAVGNSYREDLAFLCRMFGLDV